MRHSSKHSSTPLQGSRAVKALVIGAEVHARHLGDATTGAEHLLMAAFDLPDGSARRAFRRAGGDPDDFAAAVARQHADALRGVGIEPVPDRLLTRTAPLGSRRPNESAMKVLKAAIVDSKIDRLRPLGVHVLAAVAGLEHGTAARTLRGMGLERRALADAAIAEVDRA